MGRGGAPDPLEMLDIQKNRPALQSFDDYGAGVQSMLSILNVLLLYGIVSVAPPCGRDTGSTLGFGTAAPFALRFVAHLVLLDHAFAPHIEHPTKTSVWLLFVPDPDQKPPLIASLLLCIYVKYSRTFWSQH